MSLNPIHIVFGPQGAGKTTYARELAEELGGTRFSIDEWMGELFGPDLPRPMSLPWIMERVRRCERRIWMTAADIAKNGGTVVLDLGFMKISDRSTYRELAAANAFPVQWHFVTAPHDQRRGRVLSRNVTKGATFSFEVTPAMFDFMERQFEPPTEAERSASIERSTAS